MTAWRQPIISRSAILWLATFLIGWECPNLNAVEGGSFWDPPRIGSIRDAVVGIEADAKPGKAGRRGTGFIVSQDGLIITTRHIFHQSSRAWITLRNGKRVGVDGWVADDPSHDLVVLKVAMPSAGRVAFAPFKDAREGTKVCAIGRRSGEREGTVLSSNELLQGYRWIAAKILVRPGDSGGPAFDESGRLVGIVAAQMEDEEHGLLIPGDDIKKLLGGIGRTPPKPFSELKVRPVDELYGDPDFKAGLRASISGDNDQAITRMKKAVGSFPNSAVCRLLLGSCLATQNQFRASEDSYQSAVTLKPDYALAFAYLGATIAAQGRNAEALTACQKAVKIQPSLAEAWMNIGAIYLELKRYDDARLIVKKLRELSGGDQYAQQLESALGKVTRTPAR